MTSGNKPSTIYPALALALCTAAVAAKPGGGGGKPGGGGNKTYPLRATVCDTAHVTGDSVDATLDPLCNGAPSATYQHDVGGVLAHIRSNCNLNFWLQDSGNVRTLNVLYDDPRVPILDHQAVVNPKINTHPREATSLKLGDMAVGEQGHTAGGLTWKIPDDSKNKKGKPVDNTETYQNAFGRFCEDLSFDVGTVYSVERPDQNTWILEGTQANLCLDGPAPQVINGVNLGLRLVLRCVDETNCPLPGSAVTCNP